MASKRTQILEAVVERVRSIPSASDLGSVNAGVRHFMQVRDQPSVDVVLGSEDREQQPGFQAKRTTTASVWVWGKQGEDQQTEDLCEEIENAIRDEMTFGGLVTASYATGITADDGTLAQDAVGALRIVEFLLRYHETEQ
jgi:hypothetical protein